MSRKRSMIIKILVNFWLKVDNISSYGNNLNSFTILTYIPT